MKPVHYVNMQVAKLLMLLAQEGAENGEWEKSACSVRWRGLRWRTDALPVCPAPCGEHWGVSLVAPSPGTVRQSRNQPETPCASKPNSSLADIVGVVCRGRLTERA